MIIRENSLALAGILDSLGENLVKVFWGGSLKCLLDQISVFC